MSISGAVAELNKEIERLTKIRDSLLQGAAESAVYRERPAVPARRGRPAKKSVSSKTTSSASKKAAATKSPAPAKKSAPAKKRTMSPEARKRIGDAARARWAARKKAPATK